MYLGLSHSSQTGSPYPELIAKVEALGKKLCVRLVAYEKV